MLEVKDVFLFSAHYESIEDLRSALLRMIELLLQQKEILNFDNCSVGNAESVKLERYADLDDFEVRVPLFFELEFLSGYGCVIYTSLSKESATDPVSMEPLFLRGRVEVVFSDKTPLIEQQGILRTVSKSFGDYQGPVKQGTFIYPGDRGRLRIGKVK